MVAEPRKARIAVLISGSGTNLQAIIDRTREAYEQLHREQNRTDLLQGIERRRDEIALKKDLPAAEVEAAVLALDAVQRALAGARPKKVIVVPNRIVNLVM